MTTFLDVFGLDGARMYLHWRILWSAIKLCSSFDLCECCDRFVLIHSHLYFPSQPNLWRKATTMRRLGCGPPVRAVMAHELVLSHGIQTICRHRLENYQSASHSLRSRLYILISPPQLRPRACH